MIRLAWRQTRMPAAATAALLVILAAFLAATKHAMDSYQHRSGLAGCLASGGDCTQAVIAFVSRYSILLGLFALLNVVPMLAGLFWGAPLVAREIEQGTHRLVWTQSVTRRRWLMVKTGMFVIAAILAAAIVTALFAWWSRPFARIDQAGSFGLSRINPDVYDFSGTVLIGYTLYSFALGTAAGAFIRRTVPAMAVSVAGFLALRIPMEMIRGQLFAPLSYRYPNARQDPRAGLGDWVLSSTPVNRAGRPLPVLCGTGTGNSLGPVGCHAAGHVFGTSVIYQPLTRFWPLQGIETGIVVAVAAALLAAATWRTIRCIS